MAEYKARLTIILIRRCRWYERCSIGTTNEDMFIANWVSLFCMMHLESGPCA